MFNWVLARMVAAALAAVVIASFYVIVLLFLPRPLPGIRGEVGLKPNQPDGIVETRYWIGLLKERWNYKGGLPNGVAIQYYPNGSMFRQLFYVDGKLNGVCNEYYERPTYRGGVGRRAFPKKRRESFEKGPLKATWHYVGGKRDGEYKMYYLGGVLKEEGLYSRGKRVGTVKKYSEEGELISEKHYGGSGSHSHSLFIDRTS